MNVARGMGLGKDGFERQLKMSEEQKEIEEKEEQLTKLAEDCRHRLEEEAAAKARVEAISEPSNDKRRPGSLDLY